MSTILTFIKTMCMSANFLSNATPQYLKYVVVPTTLAWEQRFSMYIYVSGKVVFVTEYMITEQETKTP